MKARAVMYEVDEGAWSIGIVVLIMFAVFIVWLSAPAHSQEAPSGPPCGPSHDIHEHLQQQYGETIRAGGIIGQEYMELLTSKSGTFTILMRRLDGTACIVAGGTGFALADPARMKGNGL